MEQPGIPPPGQGSRNQKAHAMDSSEEDPVLDPPIGHWAWHPIPQASRKRKLTEPSGINDSLLVPMPVMERSRPANQLVPLEDAGPGQPSAAGAASSISAQLVPAEDAPAGHPSASGRTGSRGSLSHLGQRRDILATVDGVNIVRDTHLLPGMPGHYDRAVVGCRLHSFPESGVFCKKSRVVGQKVHGQLWSGRARGFLGQLDLRCQPFHRQVIPYKVPAWSGRRACGHCEFEEQWCGGLKKKKGHRARRACFGR